MNTRELFEGCKFEDVAIRKNIALYLRAAVGYKVKTADISYQTVDVDGLNMYVVILKDDIRRVDKSQGGSGVLRQRQWSVFIFNFIAKSHYVKYFGSNVDKKEIMPPFEDNSCKEFSYDKSYKAYGGSNPDGFYSSRRIKHLLHNYIFYNLHGGDYRYLFLNTYVYSIIGILDGQTGDIVEKGFSTFYYNTNHVFRQVNSTPIISQKADINKTSYLVEAVDKELELIRVGYLDMVDLVNAYKGSLAMNSQTSLNYENIKKDIDAGKHFIVTEGMARTGKTVIAMRILGAYPESKLLILNFHFYKTLQQIFETEKVVFPVTRIAHHAEHDYANHIIKTAPILIVDEAQRLSESELESILSKNEKSRNIFLGDNLQKLNKEYDRGMDRIKDAIEERGEVCAEHKFSCSIGIPNNILDAIKYMVFNDIPFAEQNINNYEINLFNDAKEFVNKYKDDNTFRKHMATIYMHERDYDVTIEGFKRLKLAEIQSLRYYFLDKDIKEGVMLTTYEMISRELDAIYIYLPSSVVADESELHYINRAVEEYMLNQLYILMTRAKGSVNIYCKNSKAYACLKERCERLKANANKQ